MPIVKRGEIVAEERPIVPEPFLHGGDERIYNPLAGRRGMNASSCTDGDWKVTAPTLVRMLAANLLVIVMALIAAASPPPDEADPGIVARQGAAPPECRSPNVLLVSLDTMRADYVGEAPFLSRLARQGRFFSKVYSSSNWTLPSHVSLMSSLPYFEHNVPPPGLARPFSGSRMPADQPTLASVLHASGYATAASTEGGWMGPFHGLEKGFDSFETVRSPANDNLNGPSEHLTFVRSFIRRRNDRPLFLFVHTYIVHDYFINTDAYHGLITAADAPYVAYGNLVQRMRAKLPPAPSAFLKRLYTAGVRTADEFVDQLVGTVRDETGDAPLLVVVTSDHGESLAEHHGEFHHGVSLNDLQTRIPLVVWTNVAPPLRGALDSLASTIDIAPSVVRWLGLPVPPRFRGRDDLLQPSPGPPLSPVLVLQYAEADGARVGRIRHALIWNDSKYVRSDRLDGTNVSEQCYPIPQAPEDEPGWGGPITKECLPFRQRLARALEVLPERSFRLEESRPVEIRLGRSADGRPLAAVFSAYPSATPILSFDNGVLSWVPPKRGGWLVGYPSDPQLSFSSIAVGGRTRFKDVRPVDLAASPGPAGGSTSSHGARTKERFEIRTRDLGAPRRPPPRPDEGLRERLRALGYEVE